MAAEEAVNTSMAGPSLLGPLNLARLCSSMGGGWAVLSCLLFSGLGSREHLIPDY